MQSPEMQKMPAAPRHIYIPTYNFTHTRREKREREMWNCYIICEDDAAIPLVRTCVIYTPNGDLIHLKVNNPHNNNGVRRKEKSLFLPASQPETMQQRQIHTMHKAYGLINFAVKRFFRCFVSGGILDSFHEPFQSEITIEVKIVLLQSHYSLQTIFLQKNEPGASIGKII